MVYTIETSFNKMYYIKTQKKIQKAGNLIIIGPHMPYKIYVIIFIGPRIRQDKLLLPFPIYKIHFYPY